MFGWFKRLLTRAWEGCKRLAVEVVAVVKTVYRFCTATRFRRNLSIAVIATALLATMGLALGLFAAAYATVTMGFLGQAMITFGGVTLLSTLLAATQFGVSTGGGGTLMLYSLATGQYYITLIAGLWMLFGFAALAGIATWSIAAMLHAPGWLVVAMAFCHTNPVIAAALCVVAIVAALYLAEFIVRLAFKLVRLVWQFIARRNQYLLPAPV